MIAVLLVVPVPVQAQEAQDEAPGESSPVFAQVDYMKVEPGQASEYVQTELEVWKPIHQARIDDGKILGWNLYAVNYPAGTGHDYNFVTVTFYDNLDDVENIDFQTYAQRAHPDKEVGTIMQRTSDARDLVRGELWVRHEQVAPATSPSEPPSFLRLDYMKVAPGDGSEYVNVERDVWKPVHQARADSGAIASWGLWQMALPGGTSQPHNYATATAFQSMADMAVSYSDLFERVHPDRSPAEITEQTFQTRDLVQTELWELVDSVSGAASTSTSER